ncbi:MAG: cytidylate kinase family protein [Candidatus Thermoplasmatota archaeon]|nr:cytidylate kinase family protein [Candidatus Thermoplasmatota archaeon]MEE3310725.1 cytidylate kinase family protein [Candidatus Thermoplasmatota archaeon]
MGAKLTISGHPGSGTSTLVDGLCRSLNWQRLNGGQVFRDMANERGVSLEEFANLCMEDEAIDQELDALLSETMQSDDSPEIVESRLAGWWAHKNGLQCARVWIEVSESVRATRVVNREGGSIDEQLNLIKERMKSDGERYERFYGIDIDSREPYTCIIESDDLGIEEVVSHVLEHLGDYL